ncbi:protein of unknown function [Agreia sp. COWG]|nr:protein of unknown function [Agreia sp. COWG]
MDVLEPAGSVHDDPHADIDLGRQATEYCRDAAASKVFHSYYRQAILKFRLVNFHHVWVLRGQHYSRFGKIIRANGDVICVCVFCRTQPPQRIIVFKPNSPEVAFT